MAFEYEIDNKNVVTIWVNKAEDEAPLILQPSYPDGSKWSKEQATAWAESYCSYANDPAYPYIPGINADEPVRLKPIEAEIQPELLDEVAANASSTEEASSAEETPAE